MKHFVTAALLTGCCVSSAAAQRLRPSPFAGEQIRVSPQDSAPFTGTLTALGGDTLVLATSGAGPVFVLVSRQPVEVYRRKRELWSGLGALAGASAGVITSLIGHSGSGAAHAMGRSVVSAAGGALVGGLLGFSVAPSQWQRLRGPDPGPLPQPPAVVAASPPDD